MRSSTSRCRVISITFPSHPHHIPITFPAHFNRIPITYISITFPAHSQHISITFPSHSHHTSTSLPPHASRPAASNLSNFSVFRDSKSGTSNTTSNAAYARRCMLWRWPRPQLQRPHSCGCLHDCCSLLFVCVGGFPENTFMWRKHETVQNWLQNERNGSELVTRKRNGSESTK